MLPKQRVNGVSQCARSLAVDDPHLQDAAFTARIEIRLDNILHIARRERMKIQFAGDGDFHRLGERLVIHRAIQSRAASTRKRRRAYAARVSSKSAKIAALIEPCRGRGLDAHYLGYFECFNRGLFYEAHDVLEELWLADKHGPNGNFYKGLIQFAGAFVHLQKHSAKYARLRPAAALLTLARTNLEPYPARHERLDVAALRETIADWLARLDAGNYSINPLVTGTAPTLELTSD